MERIQALLATIYGEAQAPDIAQRISDLIAQYPTTEHKDHQFDHTDTILITYGDMVQTEGEPPLQTLRKFLVKHIAGIVKGVHILPFYPYSSDDGFSVIDYLQVDPALGTWADVEAFGEDFRPMFDAVINHISQESDWFQAFKRGEEPYTDYFKVVDESADLSAVFRPRALPLLTPVETTNGTKHVWTTFSDDQIDLNYESADLLLEVLRVLLEYACHGAELIRLDAIAFMWKQVGTRSLHRPQTHALIQLMRAVLNEAAPQVALVTETNVPHHENISYFGDGYNEAQMVYNFSLPPLLLHAFHTGDATILSKWASTLELPSEQTTFFNFCASHDGIGVTPARGLLSDEQIAAMAQRVEALGGFVSYKNNANGTQSAYELNINYLDALGDPDVAEDLLLQARRFLCSQAIMLTLRGVPGIYFHSLFGSRSWHEGVEKTGRKRTINREKLQRSQLEAELQGTFRNWIFDNYCQTIQERCGEPAFHPHGGQEILPVHPQLFVIRRWHGEHSVVCWHNVSAETLNTFTLSSGLIESIPPYGFRWQKSNDSTN